MDFIPPRTGEGVLYNAPFIVRRVYRGTPRGQSGGEGKDTVRIGW